MHVIKSITMNLFNPSNVNIIQEPYKLSAVQIKRPNVGLVAKVNGRGHTK